MPPAAAEGARARVLVELSSRDGFSEEAVEHLHLLVGEWQMLADLGFGDVHLTFPDRSFEPAPGAMRLPARDTDFLILDHARPGTTQTLFPADQIGQHLGPRSALCCARSGALPV